MGLTGPKSRCRQGCVPFWRLLKENPFSCLFHLLEQPTLLGCGLLQSAMAAVLFLTSDLSGSDSFVSLFLI